MHENALTARTLLGKLTNRLEEWQALDIAHCAADFAEHEVDLIIADFDEVFDFIGDMGNDLNGFAQIITAALFFEHVGINAP